VVWLILFTVQATRELVTGGYASILTVAVTYCVLALLLLIVGLAYPAFRQKQHNRFEASHRFFGWSATALVWVQVRHVIYYIMIWLTHMQVVSLVNDYRLPGQTLGHALVHAAPFWLVTVLTASIILPWIRLRKVPVRSVVMSKHAIRLYFDYGESVAVSIGPFTQLSFLQLRQLQAPLRASPSRLCSSGTDSPLYQNQTNQAILWLSRGPETGQQSRSIILPHICGCEGFQPVAFCALSRSSAESFLSRRGAESARAPLVFWSSGCPSACSGHRQTCDKPSETSSLTQYSKNHRAQLYMVSRPAISL